MFPTKKHTCTCIYKNQYDPSWDYFSRVLLLMQCLIFLGNGCWVLTNLGIFMLFDRVWGSSSIWGRRLSVAEVVVPGSRIFRGEGSWCRVQNLGKCNIIEGWCGLAVPTGEYFRVYSPIGIIFWMPPSANATLPPSILTRYIHKINLLFVCVSWKQCFSLEN